MKKENGGAIYCILWIIASLWLSGCSTTRTLAPDEKLYRGSTFFVQLDSTRTYSEKKLVRELRKVEVLQPNRTLLGIPFRLWLHNIFATEKEKGLWYSLQQKVGQPPVVLDSLAVDRTSERMEQQLFNLGHFRAEVEPHIQSKKKKARVQYTVAVQPPYRIDTISYDQLPTDLLRIARARRKDKAVQVGQPYRLTDLRTEVRRIEQEMQKLGYYFFQRKYLRWQADTLNRTGRGIWLQLTLAPDVPERALSVQRIGAIDIYSDYQPNRTDWDTLQYRDVRFYRAQGRVRPRVLYHSILLRLLDRYNPERQQNTLERLSRMGYYRFVNLRFSELTELDSLLRMSIYLTPRTRHTLEGSLGLSYKPAAFWGPEFSVTYINRNLFGGAEELRLSGSGLFNFPLANAAINQDFQETDADLSIRVPGLQIPFSGNRKRARLRVAATTHRFSLERERINIPLSGLAPIINVLGLGNLQDKLARDSSANTALRFNKYTLAMEYEWQRQPTIINRFTPLDLSFQDVRFQDLEFFQLLRTFLGEANQLLFLRQLQDIATVQTRYQFLYDSQPLGDRPHRYVYEGAISYGWSGVIPQELAGKQSINQFVGLENLFRYAWSFGPRHTLASRFTVNTIIPVRDEVALPILDYFRIGGPNSLRGFRPRGLGPGTLDPEDTEGIGILAGQGELLLEGSLEYRYKATSIIELATFVDAGNVWLVTDLIANETTDFDWGNFTRELGINTGLGIRLDFNFLLLRLDFGFPLTKPWLPKGQRWVGDEIDFGAPVWRRENLIVNLSFGYPF